MQKIIYIVAAGYWLTTCSLVPENDIRKPSESSEAVPNYLDEVSEEVEPNKSASIRISATTVTVDAGTFAKMATVRLRTVAPETLDEEEIDIGEIKGDVIRLEIVDTETGKISSSESLLKNFRLAQSIKNFDAEMATGMVVKPNPDNPDSKAVLIGKSDLDIVLGSEASLNLQSSDANISSMLGVTTAVIWIVQYPQGKVQSIASVSPTDIVATEGGDASGLNYGPSLSSVTPVMGSENGNTLITIKGTKLSQFSSINIGGNLCSDLKLTGETLLTCRSPSGAVGSLHDVEAIGTDLNVVYPTKFRYIATGLESLPPISSDLLRTGGFLAWTGEDILLWGGADNLDNYPSNGGLLAPGPANEWRALPVSGDAPVGRQKFQASWTGTQMLITGGMSKAEVLLTGQGEIYDSISQQWNKIPENGLSTGMYSSTPNSSSFWTGSEMIIWGNASQDPDHPNSAGAIYNLAEKKWREVPHIPSIATRRNHCQVWTGEKLIVWGGVGEAALELSDGGIYNLSNNTWEVIEAAPVGIISARTDSLCAWSNGEFYVFGGMVIGSEFQEAAKYNVAEKKWYALNPALRVISASFSSSIYNDDGIFIAGVDESPQRNTHLDFFSFKDQAWTTLATSLQTSDAPMMLWTGAQVIIYGGTKFNGAPSELGNSYTP